MPLVVAAVFAGALVQSATGLGFALVAGPVIVAVLEPETALLTLTVLGLALSLLVASERDAPVAWGPLRPVLVAAVPGTVVGALALWAMGEEALQAAVGVAVLAAVVLQARGRPLRGPAPAIGMLSGALTTSVGVNGPPLALWLTGRGVEGAALRATLAAAFVVLGAIGVVVLVVAGAGLDLAETGAALVAVLAGHRLGRLAFARLDAAAHARVVLGVIAVSGAASVVAAVA